MNKVKQKLVPELRFPDFEKSDNWENIKLIDVTDKNKKWSFTGGPFGSNLKSSDYVEEKEGIRIIQLQNIGDGEFKNDYKIYTSKEKADELLSCNIYPGDIIMSKMGDPVGRACLIPDYHNRYVMSSDGIRIAVDENKYYKYFIYLVINSKVFRSKVENSSTGSTRKRIGLIDLKKLTLTIPKDKGEQQKIANCLSSLDNLITAETEKLDHLKDHKKGLLQQLFPANGETKPQFRFPEFKNDGDWESFSLGDLISKNSLKNKKLKYTLIQSVSNKYGFINQNEYFENRRIASKNTSNYYIIDKSCFAYNPSRINIGSLAYKFDNETSIISPLYISFKAKKEFLVDYFLLNWFSTEEFILQMKDLIKGGVRDTLSYNSLIEIKISVSSSIQEQQKIANTLSSVDTLIEIQTTKIETLKNHKKGLMQQLFPNSI